MMEPDDYHPAILDPCWICPRCGCVDLGMSDDELCRQCQPERVLTFAELAARALTGEVVEVERRWRIG